MLNQGDFLPASFYRLQNYNLKAFASDLIAGITVGLVALPLAMAFAIASGTVPQSGIYCAIIAGFIISALGGSTVQIGGPTGAFVVVVSGIIEKHGMDGLFTCTILAGAILVALGVTGMGAAIKYVPRPVVIGFTNGIAVLIASTQIRDFFGLQMDSVPGEFLHRVADYAKHWGSLSLTATVLSVSSLAGIVLLAKFAKVVPGAIVAMVAGTAIAWGFGLPVETIETRFGGIPSGLPKFELPTLRPDLALALLSPALTIAMLGAIESLLSAVVADRMTGEKHNPNVELTAQGLANLATPLFGGLPATGAIARTATNVRSGAKTPMAGMIHAVVLLCVVVFAAPLVKHAPLCVLSAILFVVAYNMGEWREIPEILKLSRADITVWIITFALTVFADLTVAVEAGMILAALLYIRKVTLTTSVTRVTKDYVQAGFAHSLQANEIPDGAVVYRIHGPFLFGATDKLEIVEKELHNLPKVVVLRLRNMNAIDATGLHALELLADKLKVTGRTLILCGAREQPSQLMRQAEFDRHIGHQNIVPTLKDAVARAREVLET